MFDSPKTLARILFLLVLLTLAGCRSAAETIDRDLRLNLGGEPATVAR